MAPQQADVLADTMSDLNLFRRLLDDSSDPIFSFDPDCRYLYANQAFADGIGINLDEVIGKTLWDVFPENEAAKRFANLRWVFEHKESKVIELLISRPDGDHYYLTTLKPILDDRGRVSAVLANSKDISRRNKLEADLRCKQTMLARTENFTHIGSWEWDVATDHVTWSDELFRIFQRDPADGAPSFAEHAELYCPEDMPRLRDAVEATIGHGTPYEIELRAIRQDGETRVCLARGYAEMDPDQTITRLFGSLQDITERKQAEAALSESERKFRLIAENTSDGIAILDKDGVVQYVSPSVYKQLGYSEQEELGRSGADIHALLDPEGRDAIFQEIYEAIQAKKERMTYSYRIKHKSGHYIWREDSTNFRYASSGEYDGAYVVSRDISLRKHMEEELHQLAFFDPLTRLPNRHTLNDRLNQAMLASKRSGSYGALMMIDLDNFKPLNDAHGHHAGDLLLVEVARRLTECVRETDTVARFGGDEFVVILGELNADPKESGRLATEVAEKIRASLAVPYRVILNEGSLSCCAVEHRCSASIGVTLFLNHEAKLRDLMKWADSAMYLAKEAGRNAIRFYGLTQ